MYYQWETGPNPYNQFAAVKGSNGQFVNFDAPLQVNFAVPQGAAFGEYAGKSIVLQYGGFGELWGLPGICVSPQTNDEVACGDGGEVRYVPSFVIPLRHDAGRRDRERHYLPREMAGARNPLRAQEPGGVRRGRPHGAVGPDAADAPWISRIRRIRPRTSTSVCARS